MKTLRRHKYAILLAAIICVILIHSFGHRRLLGPVASDLVIFTMLVLVYLIVFDRWENRAVAFISLASAFTAAGALYLLPPSYLEIPIRLFYHSALLLLLGFATIVILRNIFKQRIVGSDDVLGAVCGYLLAAGTWSNLFMLFEIFVPESFTVGEGFESGLDTWDGRIAVLNYVSLGSLTSVGSGAVVPIRPPRHGVDHPRSGVRAVLHRGRGRAIGGCEALSGAAAQQLTANLSARLHVICLRPRR